MCGAHTAQVPEPRAPARPPHCGAQQLGRPRTAFDAANGAQVDPCVNKGCRPGERLRGTGNTHLSQDLEASLEICLSDNLVPSLEKKLNDLTDGGFHDISAEFERTCVYSELIWKLTLEYM